MMHRCVLGRRTLLPPLLPSSSPGASLPPAKRPGAGGGCLHAVCTLVALFPKLVPYWERSGTGLSSLLQRPSPALSLARNNSPGLQTHHRSESPSFCCLPGPFTIYLASKSSFAILPSSPAQQHVRQAALSLTQVLIRSHMAACASAVLPMSSGPWATSERQAGESMCKLSLACVFRSGSRIRQKTKIARAFAQGHPTSDSTPASLPVGNACARRWKPGSIPALPAAAPREPRHRGG